MLPTVRLVAIDIDGTLLDSHGKVTSGTLRALQEFKHAGGIVCIATGRPPAGVRSIVAELNVGSVPDLVEYVVCSEGSAVLRIPKVTEARDESNWELLWRNWTPASHVSALITAMDEEFEAAFCQVGDRSSSKGRMGAVNNTSPDAAKQYPLAWAVELSDGAHMSCQEYYTLMDEVDAALGRHIRATALLDTEIRSKLANVGQVRTHTHAGWARCMPLIRGISGEQLLPIAEAALLKARQHVNESMREDDSVPPFTMGVSISPDATSDGTGSVVFQQADLEKSAGLEIVCKAVGLASSGREVCAFGDGDNDVGMLVWAGRSVCPSNAVAAAKASAKVVSSLSNDEDFIADAIYHFDSSSGDRDDGTECRSHI